MEERSLTQLEFDNTVLVKVKSRGREYAMTYKIYDGELKEEIEKGVDVLFNAAKNTLRDLGYIPE